MKTGGRTHRCILLHVWTETKRKNCFLNCNLDDKRRIKARKSHFITSKQPVNNNASTRHPAGKTFTWNITDSFDWIKATFGRLNTSKRQETNCLNALGSRDFSKLEERTNTVGINLISEIPKDSTTWAEGRGGELTLDFLLQILWKEQYFQLILLFATRGCF